MRRRNDQDAAIAAARSVDLHQAQNALAAFASILRIEFLVAAGDHHCPAVTPAYRRTDTKDALARVGDTSAIGPGFTELPQNVASYANAPGFVDRIRGRKIHGQLITGLSGLVQRRVGLPMADAAPVVVDAIADLPSLAEAQGRGNVGRDLPELVAKVHRFVAVEAASGRNDVQIEAGRERPVKQGQLLPLKDNSEDGIADTARAVSQAIGVQMTWATGRITSPPT